MAKIVQNRCRMEHERYRDVAATLGSDLFARVQAAKVLVVGAGGIGCELLKNLVMMGFIDIETVPPPLSSSLGCSR